MYYGLFLVPPNRVANHTKAQRVGRREARCMHLNVPGTRVAPGVSILLVCDCHIILRSELDLKHGHLGAYVLP